MLKIKINFNNNFKFTINPCQKSFFKKKKLISATFKLLGSNQLFNIIIKLDVLIFFYIIFYLVIV